MAGGLSEEIDATDEIQQLCEEVKEEFLIYTGQNSVEKYDALKYKSQIVAGTNYFVKIQVADGEDGECVHVKVFKPLPYMNKCVELAGVQTGKMVDDPIEYF